MKKVAFIPGSFDPITLGHYDLIERASKMFEKVVVAVMINGEKKFAFTAEERYKFAVDGLKNLENVEVIYSEGMVCEIAKELDAVIIKGVRNTTDFDYEYNLSLINRSAGDVETLLLPASPETAFISSTMVREFLRLEKDVTKYIPQNTKIESAGK
jgi:pantetheine-phosphate adenylyltransferase